MGESALRVLIVDDEAPARRRLRELLDDCTGVLALSGSYDTLTDSAIFALTAASAMKPPVIGGGPMVTVA